MVSEPRVLGFLELGKGEVQGRGFEVDFLVDGEVSTTVADASKEEDFGGGPGGLPLGIGSRVS